MRSGRKFFRVRVCSVVAVVSLSVLVVTPVLVVAWTSMAHAQDGKKKEIRGLIGKDSKKILVQDGKTLLWASGDVNDPEKSHWYDFTGAPLPAGQSTRWQLASSWLWGR